MKIVILWHIDHEFYNIRVPKGMKTISQSAMKMRHKIYNVEGVKWKYHVVLTLSEQDVKKYENKIDSSILRTFLTKLGKIFPEETHFWKYEEGRKSERPHFHLLFDLKEKIEDKSEEIEKVVTVGNLYEFVENQRKYKLNEKKSDREIIMGYLMFKLWNKGIAHARFIKNEIELAAQVEKDVAKRTGTEGFKENKRKYGFSRGLKIQKVVKERQYEWAGNVGTVNEAMYYLELTKENFVNHFNHLEYSGEMIYDYTVEDLKSFEKKQKREIEDKKQVVLSEFQ